MRTNPHCSPAKRESGAAGTGGGWALTATLTPGAASHNAAPSSASPATLHARVIMSAARFSPDGVQEQFLRPFEARRDLERGERLLLGFDAIARQQIALAEIAVRRGLVGGAGVDGGAEL